MTAQNWPLNKDLLWLFEDVAYQVKVIFLFSCARHDQKLKDTWAEWARVPLHQSVCLWSRPSGREIHRVRGIWEELLWHQHRLGSTCHQLWAYLFALPPHQGETLNATLFLSNMLITSPHHPSDLILTIMAWQEYNYTFSYPEQLKLFFCCCLVLYIFSPVFYFVLVSPSISYIHIALFFLFVSHCRYWGRPTSSPMSSSSHLLLRNDYALCWPQRGRHQRYPQYSVQVKMHFVHYLTFIYFYFLLFCI